MMTVSLVVLGGVLGDVLDAVLGDVLGGVLGDDVLGCDGDELGDDVLDAAVLAGKI